MGLSIRLIDNIFNSVINTIYSIEKSMIERKLSQVPDEYKNKVEQRANDVSSEFNKHLMPPDLILMLYNTYFKILPKEKREKYFKISGDIDKNIRYCLLPGKDMLSSHYEEFMSNPEKCKELTYWEE